MWSLVWTKVLLKSVAAIGGTCSILSYRINNNLFQVDNADAEKSTTWDYYWDIPEGFEDEERTKAKRNIFLIRHGNYDHKSTRLNAKGKLQAQYASFRLLDLNYNYGSTIYASTMPRARETAIIIKEKLPHMKLLLDDDLCEGIPIRPEPSSVYYSKIRDEQIQDDGERIDEAFDYFFHRAESDQKEDSYELIVCHANVIRYLICRALQLPLEAWARFSLNHGSITWITIHPDGRVQLKSAGDAEFMPNNLLTLC